MASFANNDKTPQQQGRRRGNSSYEVRIESPTYPIEQQIQLYKFKPVPFQGQSVAQSDYVQHELQMQRPVSNQPQRLPPKIPFTGQSTSRSDFIKHANVETRQSVNVVPEYVRSKAPFYGQTTAGDTFIKHNLDQVQHTRPPPSQPRVPPNIPFTGQSTSRSDFIKHTNVETRQSVNVVPEYVPSKAPFYGQTTSGDAFKEWDITTQKPTPRGGPSAVPNLPFEGESQYKSHYRRWSLGKSRLSVGIAIYGGIFHTMIPGNARLPATAKETVTTVNDNQRSAIVLIYQGERKLAEENLLVGMLGIKNIKPAPAGYPRFEVTINIDENNSVSLQVHNFQNGEVQHATFTTALEASELTDHVVQAKGHRVDDRVQVEKIQTTVKERNIEIEQARQLRQNIADHLDQRYSKLSDMFLSMDKNRAGTINVNELRQVCRNFNLDDRAIEKVIAWCDMDHNNVLSYDEFCKRLVQYDEGLLDGSNVKDNIITPQVGRKINF